MTMKTTKNEEKDLYAVLGVDRAAPAREIKRAFRRRAKATHPDVNASPDAAERFLVLVLAHETLIDEEARRIYDETGQAKASSGRSKEDDARALVMSLYSEGIDRMIEGGDGDVVDLVGVLRMSLGRSIERETGRLLQLNREISVLERLAGRVVRRGDGQRDSVFDSLTLEKLKQRRAARMRLAGELEVARLADGMLAECRDTAADVVDAVDEETSPLELVFMKATRRRKGAGW